LDAVLFTPKIYFANFTCNNTGWNVLDGIVQKSNYCLIK
jgi:hypothetical protein